MFKASRSVHDKHSIGSTARCSSDILRAPQDAESCVFDNSTSFDKEIEYWKEKTTGLAREVSRLKDRALDQNDELERLQEARNEEEKSQRERVLMLEMEIVRLLDMQNAAKINSRSSSSSSIPTSILCTSTPDTLKEESYSHALHSARLEIRALEDLLSKVVAKRDTLELQKEHLEKMTNKKPRDSSSTKAFYKGCYHHNETKGSIVYQLSCKKCNGKHSIVGKTDKDLRSKVKHDFKEVWKLVQADSLQTNRPVDQQDCRFGQTDFAAHVADHCKDATSHEETVQLCTEIIKVEVLRIRSL